MFKQKRISRHILGDMGKKRVCSEGQILNWNEFEN